VTDGEAGDAELVEQYLPDIISRGLVVDVIGVDMQQNHSLATKVQTYRRADDASSLQQAISAVVLGESTADASDAGESDFAILQGLPSEVAAVILKTLAEQGDHPIGQQRETGPPEPGSFEAAESVPPPSGPVAVAPPGPIQHSAPPQSGTGMLNTVLGSMCCCSVAVIFLVGFAILMVVKSSGRR